MSKVNGLFSATIGLLQKTMDLRSARHRVLSSNIANADTPNYKAFEVVVEEELRKQQASSSAIRMVRTHSGHLPAGHPAADRVTLKRSAEPEFTLRADGNTVDLDQSMSQLAENSIQYKTSAQLISGKLRSLRNAIQGGRT